MSAAESASSPPGELQSLNEFILREIETLYEPADVNLLARRQQRPGSLGLQSIAAELKEEVGSVQRKVTILILGNTNSGKSTFVNWFVYDGVVPTGVGVETQKFTIVTFGKQSNELSSESTATLFPAIRSIIARQPELAGMFISKTCPNLSGKLSLVNIIDSPGCGDGGDVATTALALAEQSDLIFMFLDPMTPTVGKNLLTLIGDVHCKFPDRLLWCLTKVDDIHSEEERIKLSCQVTQSLAVKILSRRMFDLIPVYIPGAKDGTYLSPSKFVPTKATDCLRRLKDGDKGKLVNRIGVLMEEIDRVVERKVQTSLHSLRTDTEKLIFCLEDLIEADDVVKRYNRSRYTYFIFLWFMVCILFVAGGAVCVAYLTLFHGDLTRPMLAKRIGDVPLLYLLTVLSPLQHQRSWFASFAAIFGFLFLILLICLSKQRSKAVFPRNKRISLQDKLKFLYKTYERWEELNKQYIGNSA